MFTSKDQIETSLRAAGVSAARAAALYGQGKAVRPAGSAALPAGDEEVPLGATGIGGRPGPALRDEVGPVGRPIRTPPTGSPRPVPPSNISGPVTRQRWPKLRHLVAGPARRSRRRRSSSSTGSHLSPRLGRWHSSPSSTWPRSTPSGRSTPTSPSPGACCSSMTPSSCPRASTLEIRPDGWCSTTRPRPPPWCASRHPRIPARQTWALGLSAAAAWPRPHRRRRTTRSLQYRIDRILIWLLWPTGTQICTRTSSAEWIGVPTKPEAIPAISSWGHGHTGKAED